MKKLVFLTGAGMSAESGFATFRDSGGLWEQYDVQKVASIEGYWQDPALVIQFYNERRHQLLTAQPNEGHRLVASLEDKYDVTVVTQNVEDLHERAGSKKVIHLHGELMKATSTDNPNDPDQIVTLTPENIDSKMGQKDIIKVEAPLEHLNLDALGFIDHTITVNIIKDAKIVEKRDLRLPRKLINVIHCKNPRCITSIEQGLDHVFYLADEEAEVYRCIYCEEKYHSAKKRS